MWPPPLWAGWWKRVCLYLPGTPAENISPRCRLCAAAITGCLRRALFSLGTACVICGGDTAFLLLLTTPAPFSLLHFF